MPFLCGIYYLIKSNTNKKIMKKIFSFIAAVLFAGSMMAGEVTVSKTVHDLFPDDANGTQEATLYSDANLSISVNADGNNGKVYNTGTEWRLYQTNSAVVTVQATNATIKTVAFVFTVKNTGILKFGDDTMTSGTAVNVNAASAQFTVGNSASATNGQVIVGGFTVVYETEEGGEGGDTPVIVKTLKSIALSGMKTEFETIDKFKFDGKVTATYSVVKDDEPQEDEEKEVKPTSVSEPDMTQVGEQNVTVSYTEGEVTREATYTITVTEHTTTPGTFDVALNNTFFGCATGANPDEQSARSGDITVTAGCPSTAQNKTYYDAGHVRFYTDSYLKLSVPTGYVITSIEFTAANTWNGEITSSPEGYDADKKSWAGSANEVDFAFGKQNRISSVKVTFALEGETPDPTPEVVANYCQTQVTHFNLPAETASAVLLSIGVKGEKTIVRIDKVSEEAKNLDFLQVTPDNIGSQLEEGGSEALAIEITTPAATNDSLTFQILWSVVGNGGNWMVENLRVAVADCEYAVIPAAPLPDPTNCAEAAEAALSVSADNELYNDGKEYTIEGYVTAIETAYSSKFNNISFWIADEAEGGKVIEAFRAACAAAEDAPNVGDKVSVTGKLTKYGTTPEFAAGCTFTILERAEVEEPENLGEKTIAEFLALKNEKDTCILTGTVIEIVNDQFGNLTIQDATGSLYIYGVLNAAGESKKFGELDVEVNDVLTVKALYSEFEGTPQAKNAIFVSREKAQPTAIDNAGAEMKAQKIVRDGQIIIVRGGVEYNVTGQNVR